MAEIYQRNNNSDEFLDMEYLTTLRNIKPYITCIMNNHYIELIRVWLEKLSDIHVQDDKGLRNMYLVELGKQIVNGVFVEPFIDPPDDGPLTPFKNSWNITKDKNVTRRENNNAWIQPHINNISTQIMVDSTKCSSQTVTDETTVINSNSDEQSYIIKQSSPENQLHDTHGKLSLINEISKDRCSKNIKKKKSKVKRQLNIHTVPQCQVSEETDVYQSDVNRKCCADPYKEVRVYSPLRKMKENELKFTETDDSSWYDLTDCSTNLTAAFCSGDADSTPRIRTQEDTLKMQQLYEKKISELVNLIKNLRQENTNLSKHVDICEKNLKNAKAESNLHNLAHEVEGLKTQLQELIEIKLNLQNSQFGVTSEWQSTISTLHKKMALVQRKNNELKLENSDLTRKLEEQGSEKRKEVSTQKKKLSEFHNKETDMLKQIHARTITEMEAKYIQKMANQDDDFHKRLDDIKDNYENRFNNLKDDYDTRVIAVRDDYESRINSIRIDYEKALSNKDCEIEKLEHMLQEQCVRMQEEVHLIRSQVESNMSSSNESNLGKIAFLQKCILRMEKLYQKAEKENFKQMSKLKRELEFRDKSNQLALTTQRADLLSHTADGRQNEIDIVVTQLEDYYKKKLIEHQQRALEEKRQDNKLIADLKDQLSKLNSEY